MSPPHGFEPGDRLPSRKLAPPEHGIKVKHAGSSWWGKRWLDALETALGADAGRLARGRSYARAGRTHDLLVDKGKVHAEVTGSRSTPYAVTIELETLSAAVWQRIVAQMVTKAQFAADLLSGRMPQDLEQVFQEAGSSLFPTRRSDLKTSCSCPDWGDPCKHVAATHYVLGDALDRDPFLLMELRGRTKGQLLEALRNERAARPKAAPSKPRRQAVTRKKRSKLERADYDKPRAALPELLFSFELPATHGAVLRQLGAPAGWTAKQSLIDALAPVLQAAAERARQIALASSDNDAAESSEQVEEEP